jgi:hypothetical protein
MKQEGWKQATSAWTKEQTSVHEDRTDAGPHLQQDFSEQHAEAVHVRGGRATHALRERQLLRVCGTRTKRQ